MTLPLSLQKICIHSAVVGIVSHLGYFIRGEHHLESVRLFRLSILFPVVLVVVLWTTYDISPTEAAKVAGAMFTSYLLALWTSMTIYRLIFHRLRSFPGPVLAKISKLSH